MTSQIIWSCKLIITQTAWKLDTFMFGLNMNCKTILSCSFEVTLVTIILNPFMYRKNMLFQIALLCCFILTLSTSILDSLMLTFYMCKKNTFIRKIFVTLWAFIIPPIGSIFSFFFLLGLVCLV